jgi:hypothetical protein
LFQVAPQAAALCLTLGLYLSSVSGAFSCSFWPALTASTAHMRQAPVAGSLSVVAEVRNLYAGRSGCLEYGLAE